MTRHALFLAALADSAVPGLYPVAVEEVLGAAGDRFQVGFVQDSRGGFWVVRVPRDAVAAAQQDASFALLALLGPRVTFDVPRPAGYVELKDGRRALVYPYIDGVGIDFAQLPSGPGLAADLGRLIAAVHNVDRRLYEEAAVPSYDASDSRRRSLALLDRGAATRRVPSGLLSRWERMLEDISLWRFAPTPLHGRIAGDHVLATFADPDDAASGTVRALVGWERACVGDPAEDFVDVVSSAHPDTVDTVVEAYAMARSEEPDPRIVERARIVGELRLLADFLAAIADGEREAIARAGEALLELDAEVGDTDAPTRADEEPVFETVPVDFTPDPVGSELYSSGSAVRPDPAPPAPAVTEPDRRQETPSPLPAPSYAPEETVVIDRAQFAAAAEETVIIDREQLAAQLEAARRAQSPQPSPHQSPQQASHQGGVLFEEGDDSGAAAQPLRGMPRDQE